MSGWQTISRLLAYIGQQKARLAFAVVFLIAGTGAMAFQPLLFGQVVNQLAEGDASQATPYALGIIGVAVAAGILLYISNYQLAILAQRAMEDLRDELFTKMQTLSLAFFDSEQSGDLNARITSDIEAVNQFYSVAVARIVSTLITVITMVWIMVSLDLVMAGVVLLIIPVAVIVMSGLGKRVQADFVEYQQLVGELNGYVEEAIVGQRTIKAYAQEETSVDRVRELSEKARDVDRSAQFRAYLMVPSNSLVSNLDVALVALIGGSRAVTGAITVGAVVTFIGYAQQFGGQTRQLTQVVTQILQAIAGAKRVFAILDRTPAIADTPSATAMPTAEGKVDFDHVDFRYVPETQILFDNDFHVEPGQLIGLVGPTGAGKSTIINLLTRFYEIESGKIALDDRTIVDIKLNDLRQRCSVVLQTPFLFTESVMYNLGYGREGATEEECIEAANRANAHEFIQRLPHGYDTVLTGGGEALSQGQRQLLTIARAIVSDSDVLILDEATSSVDTRTERRIQEALDTLMEGRTSFVIAHRLSTVRNADEIIVIDGGRIQEIGSHDDLMAARGYYYKLYMEQFRPELAEAFS